MTHPIKATKWRPSGIRRRHEVLHASLGCQEKDTFDKMPTSRCADLSLNKFVKDYWCPSSGEVIEKPFCASTSSVDEARKALKALKYKNYQCIEKPLFFFSVNLVTDSLNIPYPSDFASFSFTPFQCLLNFNTLERITQYAQVIAAARRSARMIEIVNPNGDISPPVAIRPELSLSASSLTDFTNHSAQKSVMTNYDYTQYDAVAARLQAKAARDTAELEEYNSILDDDEGFGIHKCRPVADDEGSATDPPGGQEVEEWVSASAISLKSKRSLGIHSSAKYSSGIKLKSKRSWDTRKKAIDDKGSGSNIHQLSRGKNTKSGINAIKETYLTTPETNASSRQLKAFSYESETPLVTNSSGGRRTTSLVDPPIITPNFTLQKEKSKQLLDKFIALKNDDKSASTALTSRLTDDDTTTDGVVANSTNVSTIASRAATATIALECLSFRAADEADDDTTTDGVVANSTNSPTNSFTYASRETTEEIEVEQLDSFCGDENAAEDIFKENVISYNSFFSSSGSGDAVHHEVVSVARTFSTGQETESKTEIVSQPSVTEQAKEDKETSVSGLACINKLDKRKLSYGYYEGSLSDDDESDSDSSLESMDSLIRKQTFSCDPCGIGVIVDDISDAIHDIVSVFNFNSMKSQAEVSQRKGNSTDSRDDQSKTRRKAKFLRRQERELSKRMMV